MIRAATIKKESSEQDCKKKNQQKNHEILLSHQVWQDKSLSSLKMSNVLQLQVCKHSVSLSQLMEKAAASGLLNYGLHQSAPLHVTFKNLKRRKYFELNK